MTGRRNTFTIAVVILGATAGTLALGHLVAPLLTCSAGCAYHEQEMGR